MATIMVPVVNRVREKNLLWISLVALLLTSVVMVGTVMSPAPTTVYVHPTKTTGVNPPNTFTVAVRVDIEEPTLYGWEFTLEFDPGLLEVPSDIEEGWKSDTWYGTGTQTTFQTIKWPVVPDSEEIYVNDVLMNKPDDYDIVYENGTITFTTAPDLDTEIIAMYQFSVTVYHVTNGGFLEETGWATAWGIGVVAPSVNNMNGSVSVGNVILADELTGNLPAEGAYGIEKVLANIEFQVIENGITPLDIVSTELDTVIGDPPDQTLVVIDPNTYTVEDGVFDNRIEKLPPYPYITVSHPGMVVPVVDRPITFNASASNDPDGGWIVSYDWDFGDGTTDSGMIVDHTFAMVGSYTVNLTVFDNDGLNGTATASLTIWEWMEGGEFPDLVEECAWPEKEKWHEVKMGRELKLFGLVGNPTDENFEVYVEFTIYDKAEAKKLGTITTETVTINGNQTLELNAIMDLRDTRWRVGPDKVNWGWGEGKNLVWATYTAFARCYHNVNSEFEKGLVTKDFGYKVKPAKADIAILEVTTNATNGVLEGQLLEIYVNVTNEGSSKYPVTFNITVTYRGITTPPTELEVRPIDLLGDEPRVETFTLDTTGMTTEGYIVMVELTTLTYELDTADNSGTCTFVIV